MASSFSLLFCRENIFVFVDTSSSMNPFWVVQIHRYVGDSCWNSRIVLTLLFVCNAVTSPVI